MTLSVFAANLAEILLESGQVVTYRTPCLAAPSVNVVPPRLGLSPSRPLYWAHALPLVNQGPSDYY